MKVALSFDDVLLVPKYNTIKSRKDVDTSVKLSDHLQLNIPLIASCMDTVCEDTMAIEMWRNGGLGIIHRYNTIEQQVKLFSNVKAANTNCAVAIGATGDYLERAEALVVAGCDVLCVDVAHGDSSFVIESIKELRRRYKSITLITGNVARGEAAARLIDAGSDCVRVGIGGGSLCTTRLVAGVGVSTLYSIMECAEYLDKYGYEDYRLLADGGIKTSGDIVKAIAAGARAVILGQLLAGTTEAPGQIIGKSNSKFKVYRGMAARSSQSNWRPEKTAEIVPEGEDTLLPYKGAAKDILFGLVGGLRSGMTYNGAHNIKELQHEPEFIQITLAGLMESKPHAKQGV